MGCLPPNQELRLLSRNQECQQNQPWVPPTRAPRHAPRPAAPVQAGGPTAACSDAAAQLVRTWRGPAHVLPRAVPWPALDLRGGKGGLRPGDCPAPLDERTRMCGPSPNWELLRGGPGAPAHCGSPAPRTPAPLSALFSMLLTRGEGCGCSFVWGLLCMSLFLSLSVAGGAFSFL